MGFRLRDPSPALDEQRLLAAGLAFAKDLAGWRRPSVYIPVRTSPEGVLVWDEHFASSVASRVTDTMQRLMKPVV